MLRRGAEAPGRIDFAALLFVHFSWIPVQSGLCIDWRPGRADLRAILNIIATLLL